MSLKETVEDLQEFFGDELTENEVKVLALCMTFPSVHANISRKLSVAQYENLTIGLSINRPIFIPKSLESTFEAMESEALRHAYNQSAKEMQKRVNRIKGTEEGLGDDD